MKVLIEVIFNFYFNGQEVGVYRKLKNGKYFYNLVYRNVLRRVSKKEEHSKRLMQSFESNKDFKRIRQNKFWFDEFDRVLARIIEESWGDWVDSADQFIHPEYQDEVGNAIRFHIQLLQGGWKKAFSSKKIVGVEG